MPITLDRRPAGAYPFGVFHTSLGSTLCTESELKSEEAVGGLPSLVHSVLTKNHHSFKALPSVYRLAKTLFRKRFRILMTTDMLNGFNSSECSNFLVY